MADSKEEQALKARVLAERCFVAGNVTAARQWMLSAVRLAPDLPGNAQVAAAYDVHAAAARRPLDWHDVLGLPRRSAGGLTHDAVKKQHRKLCLLVHPDKNPSAAADGAFKLIQAALDALSSSSSCHTMPPPNASAAGAAASTPHAARPPSPPPRQRAAPRQRRERRWVSPPPPAPRRPTRPSAGVCPVCGAVTPYGKRNLRCMSCHWSAKGRSYVNDHDCFKYDYY